MKFNCDAIKDWRKARRDAENARARSWHPCFALFPIKVDDKDCRWFEVVERRAEPRYSRGSRTSYPIVIGWRWTYRAKQ